MTRRCAEKGTKGRRDGRKGKMGKKVMEYVGTHLRTLPANNHIHRKDYMHIYSVLALCT